MRNNIWSNVCINDYNCINNKNLFRNYNKLFSYKSVILSYSALTILVTLSMKFISAKSNENISSPNISQAMFIYRLNYMPQLHARSRYVLCSDFHAHSYMRDNLFMFNSYIRRFVFDNVRKLLRFIRNREVSMAQFNWFTISGLK